MENFFELLMQPFRNIWTGLVGFIPNILAMLIIIGVGLLIAWMVKAALNKVFSTLKMLDILPRSFFSLGTFFYNLPGRVYSSHAESNRKGYDDATENN